MQQTGIPFNLFFCVVVNMWLCLYLDSFTMQSFTRMFLFFWLPRLQRVQAGYNYTFPRLYQGQWIQPSQQVQVIGDKKGGGTARALARHFDDTLASIADELQPIEDKIRLAILNVVRNPWDQIASTFARGWFHTHPNDVEDQNVFQSSEFRRIGPTLVFLNTSMRLDLRVKGNLVRNLIGRILDFFELQRATDSLEALLLPNVAEQTPYQEPEGKPLAAAVQQWWQSRAAFMSINYDDFTADPKSWISKICAFLRLSCSDDFLDSTSQAVGSKQSHPSQFIHWPSNVVRAVRVCLHKHPSLHRFQHFRVPVGAPILTDMDDDVWAMVARNECVFHPVNDTVLFQRTPLL